MTTTLIELTFLLSAALIGTAGDPPGSGGGDDDPPARTGGEVHIHCKREALLRGTRILLGDIAEIRTDDAALRDRLYDVEIGTRPGMGFNRVLRARDVLQRLVQVGLSAESFELGGADEIVVQPLSQTLDGNALVNAAEPALRAALDIEIVNEYELELMRLPKLVHVPPGRLGIELQARVDPNRVRSWSAAVTVDIVVDGEVFKSVPVQWRVHQFHYALVPTRPIKRGAPLASDAIEIRRMQATPGASAMQLRSLDAIAGKVAARDLHVGKSLLPSDLADPAIIFENDLVTLIARKGRIQVTTRGIALNAAPEGGRVTVRNLSSGKPVKGIAYGPGVVLIAH